MGGRLESWWDLYTQEGSWTDRPEILLDATETADVHRLDPRTTSPRGRTGCRSGRNLTPALELLVALAGATADSFGKGADDIGTWKANNHYPIGWAHTGDAVAVQEIGPPAALIRRSNSWITPSVRRTSRRGPGGSRSVPDRAGGASKHRPVSGAGAVQTNRSTFLVLAFLAVAAFVVVCAATKFWNAPHEPAEGAFRLAQTLVAPPLAAVTCPVDEEERPVVRSVTRARSTGY